MEPIRQSYGNTPEAEREEIAREDIAARAEIRSRYAPDLTLKFWSTGGLPGRKARVYVSRNGEDLGFLGVARVPRASSNSYERHREAKGEDFFDVKEEGTLDQATAETLRAMLSEYWTRIGEADRLEDPDQFDILWRIFLG